MKYSDSVEMIPASSIRDMMVRASKIDDVISFSVGDPDFAPADCVIDAAKAALDRKETHYAPGAGLNELRDIYAEYLSKQEGVKYTRENVIVTVGGMSCLFLTLRAIVNPDDEILVPAPYFTNYSQMIKMCYGKPVNVEVYEKDDFGSYHYGVLPVRLQARNIRKIAGRLGFGYRKTVFHRGYRHFLVRQR